MAVERTKLVVVSLGDIFTTEHRRIVELACAHSAYWDNFIRGNPLAELSWYNDLICWLVRAYPQEFELALF